MVTRAFSNMRFLYTHCTYVKVAVVCHLQSYRPTHLWLRFLAVLPAYFGAVRANYNFLSRRVSGTRRAISFLGLITRLLALSSVILSREKGSRTPVEGTSLVGATRIVSPAHPETGGRERWVGKEGAAVSVGEEWRLYQDAISQEAKTPVGTGKRAE